MKCVICLWACCNGEAEEGVVRIKMWWIYSPHKTQLSDPLCMKHAQAYMAAIGPYWDYDVEFIDL